MADYMKDNGPGAFDRGAEDKKETGGLFKRIFGFFTNRYLVLTVIYCAFAVAILVMTIQLQFSDYQKTISESSSGISRQYTSAAPRGDIYDSNGILLASSDSYSVVMISNAYLEDNDMNAMCLELSYLFDEYNCTSVSALDDYFAYDEETGEFSFLKEEEDIREWQSDTNLFALDDYAQGIIVTFSDNYVKTDPQLFFLYMRNLFGLENTYSDEEAYRILRIRYQIFQDNWSFQKGTPIEIATNVPDELITIFEEQNYHYMGIVTTEKYTRTYSSWALYCCHVLGYVGQISEESFASLSTFGYTSEDIVGKGGVESQMERYLHGTNGTTIYNVWTTEGEEGTFFAEDYGTEAVAGATVNLTIDSYLQEVGTEALKDYINEAQAAEAKAGTGYETASSGAFVMMDVNTGAVIAMGSYPNYDPNDFILANYGDEQAAEQVKYYLGIDEYEELTAEDLPLWNRAIMSMYAPGSTFKPITALAGLEDGVISPASNTLICDSPADIGGYIFRCLEMPYTGHGPLDLNSAMATSCNIYFMRLGVNTGIDSIAEMAYRFGLGIKSGIDLPGEISGVMSSRETKRLLHESEYDKVWFPANTAQASIGQFDDCFTILQLCRYCAGIATNKLVTPYVVDNVVAADGTILYEGRQESVDLGISEDNIQAVRDAMRCVATGTKYWESSAAKRFVGFPIEIVCKTGTAQTGKEEINKEYSNGLFICYAPKDDPQVALALVVEKGEWGSSTIIIAKKLIAAYFKTDYDTSSPATENYPITADWIDSLSDD